MSAYICPRCNYTTNRKSNFKHHLTRKNLCNPINTDVPIKSIAKSYGIDITSTEINSYTNSNIISNINNAQKPTQCRAHKHTQILTQNTIKCKYCNKQFNSTNSCYRHQKHYCKHKKEVTKEQIENKVKEVVEQKMREAEQKMREAEQKLIDAEQKIKEVQEETDAKVEVLADKKAQKMVLSLVDKLIPNQTTNSHNTNSHNNIQNIQNNNITNLSINLFLDKYCGDAKDLKDFVRDLQFTLEDIINTKNNGYVNGITKVVLKGLENIPAIERPIHCSNKKTGKLYIKDDGKWETDNVKKRGKTHKILSTLRTKQWLSIDKWEKEHPGWENNEKQLIERSKIIKEMIGEGNEDASIKQTNEVLKNVTKKVHIKDAMDNIN